MILIIKAPNILRIGEKFRIDLTGSVQTPAPDAQITDLELECEAGGSTYVLPEANQSQWFLDFAYTSIGTKTITATATLDDLSTVTATINVGVVIAADDIFFSSDEKLLELETDIISYLDSSKNNYNYIHRTVTTQIVNWLMITGKKKSEGVYFQAADLLVVQEVAELARFWALYLIFWNLSNKLDDHFKAKADSYLKKVENQKSVVSLTLNTSEQSGQIGQANIDNRVMTLTRGLGAYYRS